MADFCYQCTRDILGLDGSKNEFVGIQPIEMTEKGLYTEVLCEGCGFILVDHNGKRIDFINPDKSEQ